MIFDYYYSMKNLRTAVYSLAPYSIIGRPRPDAAGTLQKAFRFVDSNRIDEAFQPRLEVLRIPFRANVFERIESEQGVRVRAPRVDRVAGGALFLRTGVVVNLEIIPLWTLASWHQVVSVSVVQDIDPRIEILFKKRRARENRR